MKIQIKEIQDQLMDKMEKIHNAYNQKEAIFYHYTNFDGLKGILKEREFWFTHYQQLNDPTELLFATKIVDQAINNQLNQSHFKNFWNNFKNLYPKLIIKSKVYIFSSCEEGDYLPAWRWYGGNGSVFSIGFNLDHLNQQSKMLENNTPVVSLKVNYEISHFTAWINQFFQLTEQTITNNITNHCKNTLFSTISSVLAQICYPSCLD